MWDSRFEQVFYGIGFRRARALARPLSQIDGRGGEKFLWVIETLLVCSLSKKLQAMARDENAQMRLEIGNVLFINIVGYSKQLINGQSELLQQLNEMVRGSRQVQAAYADGKLIRLATGDGWRRFSAAARKRR